MKKKLIWILGIALLFCCLSGCGRKAEQPKTEEKTEETAATVAPEESAEPAETEFPAGTPKPANAPEQPANSDKPDSTTPQNSGNQNIDSGVVLPEIEIPIGSGDTETVPTPTPEITVNENGDILLPEIP